MGVSASGKSTVAAELAKRLGIAWEDADDLHPPGNIRKMSAGTPLTDDDRWPWLDLVGHALSGEGSRDGLVMACSALRRSYRDRLRRHAAGLRFVHLTGPRRVLEQRVGERSGHFMPGSLLESQYATLEPLEHDEAGIEVSAEMSVDEIVRRIVEWSGDPQKAAPQ